MRDKIIEKIKKEKIIAIVRGIYGEACLKLADALYEGGIRILEITFDQKNVFDQVKTADTIKLISEKFSGRLTVGAGTVTSKKLVTMANKAGAKFIISPDCDKRVIKSTIKHGLVSIPGALTPTEVKRAHLYGADFVKLFPVSNLGTAYLKAIKAPHNNIGLLAVGGVNEKNVGEFIVSGAEGVGVGGNLVNKDLIAAGRFDQITALAREYVNNLNK